MVTDSPRFVAGYEFVQTLGDGEGQGKCAAGHEVAKCRDLGTEQQQQTRFAACLA